MKRKCWILAQSPYSLQGNRRQTPRVEITGIDQPMRWITMKVGITKRWEDKQEHDRIPDTLIYKHDMITDPLVPNK